jgi:hypothetical protein
VGSCAVPLHSSLDTSDAPGCLSGTTCQALPYCLILTRGAR